MKKTISYLTASLLLTSAFLSAGADSAQTIAPAKPEASSLKYGLYIHFGTPTFVNTNKPGPILPERFAPAALDVKEWSHAAKNAGAAFAVLNVKHVIGFCLWNTQETDYNISGSPVNGDLVADFIAACQADEIVPGVSYVISDARLEGSVRTHKDPVLPVHFAAILRQITELHTRYPGLQVQIFGGSTRLSPAQWDQLINTVHKLNPQCVILDDTHEPRYFARSVLNKGWFWSPDVGLGPVSQLMQAWQQCQAEHKIFVLNVAPDTTGRIPDNQLAVLAEMKTLMARSSANPVSTPAAETKPDATKRLKEVKALFDQGLINREDYDKKVKEIMDSL